MADFFERLTRAFPTARFFQDFCWNHAAYPDITPEAALDLYGSRKSFMVAFDPNWNPSVSPLEEYPGKYTIDNLPTLLISNRPSHIEEHTFEEIGKTVSVSRDGMLQIDFAIDDVEEERSAKKITRVFRKGVSNVTNLVDMRTLKVVSEGEKINWFGPEIAQRSRDDDNFFIEFYLSRDKGRFWGHKAPPP